LNGASSFIKSTAAKAELEIDNTALATANANFLLSFTLKDSLF